MKTNQILAIVAGAVLVAGSFALLNSNGMLATATAQVQPGATDTDDGQQQGVEDEQFLDPTAAAVDMNSSKIIVSGSAASPGDEAGPFQILQILPERMDGKVYVGWISFTASAPIFVAPGFGFDSENQTLNHKEFGELIRFPSEALFTNSTVFPPEIAHGPFMPYYGLPINEGSSQFPLPSVYSASVPFAADVLEVGNVNGTKFLISYTVVADVYDSTRVSALGPAVMNTTEQTLQENIVSMVYGGVEKTTDAFSPNPIIIDSGESVTWTNDDFLPHTITSGTPEQMGTGEAGKDFDSGFVGTKSSFTHTFEQDGEYDYFCLLHPNMVGTVSVR